MIHTTTRQRGFSLLELMITLSVAAILLVIAVPNFRNLMHRSQVSSASNELVASLSYARTEAITRGQLVSMCSSTDNESCADNATFESGWIIYTYPAGSASVGKDYVAADSVLLRAITPRTGVSVRAKTSDVITFGQQGQLRPSTPLRFVTCYSGGDGVGESSSKVPGAQVDVNGSGSVVSKKLGNAESCTPA